jgi:hypothetical protein
MRYHSKLHATLWAVFAALGMQFMGCAGWRSERFDLSRLRDERAQDIDSRLSKAQPAVQNPFTTPGHDD